MKKGENPDSSGSAWPTSIIVLMDPIFNFSLNLTESESESESSMSAEYCSSDAWEVILNYSLIHGWASLLVCIFGSIANVLNIAVLTRPEMRSPTNIILTGLAMADLLVMIEYIPYAIHMHLYNRSRRDMYSYGWSVFVLFHSNFGQVCHTISIYLTVALAVWRYIAVAHPQKNREWCNNKRTYLMVAFAYVSCPILCIPLYITTEVRPQVEVLDEWGMSVNLTKHRQQMVNGTSSAILDGTTNTTLYFVKLTETARIHAVLKDINFWIYSVVIKLIPCVALTVLSIKLIMVLVETKRRRRNLTTANTVIRMGNGKEHIYEKPKKKKKSTDKERQTDRTTKMLLMVLLLFLMTELPQGILGLLSVILGTRFFNTCYTKLGEFRTYAISTWRMVITSSLRKWLARLCSGIDIGFCTYSPRLRN